MKKKKGFTLIETLVVVAIIGLIVMVGYPAFNNFYQMYKFRTTMNQLVTDIRTARQLAITVNRPVKITPVNPKDYPNAGKSEFGYAIYILNSTDIENDGGTLTNWKEAAPSKKPCGEVAEKPRFFLTPVSVKSNTFLSIEEDDENFDIVFLPTGEVYGDKYPPETGEYLDFSEDVDNPKNNKPQIILQTPANVSFNRYSIYLARSGKIGVEPYRE